MTLFSCGDSFLLSLDRVFAATVAGSSKSNGLDASSYDLQPSRKEPNACGTSNCEERRTSLTSLHCLIKYTRRLTLPWTVCAGSTLRSRTTTNLFSRGEVSARRHATARSRSARGDDHGNRGSSGSRGRGSGGNDGNSTVGSCTCGRPGISGAGGGGAAGAGCCTVCRDSTVTVAGAVAEFCVAAGRRAAAGSGATACGPRGAVVGGAMVTSAGSEVLGVFALSPSTAFPAPRPRPSIATTTSAPPASPAPLICRRDATDSGCAAVTFRHIAARPGPRAARPATGVAAAAAYADSISVGASSTGGTATGRASSAAPFATTNSGSFGTITGTPSQDRR